MLEIVPLALGSAVDPMLIASVAIMLSRERAGRLLVAYLVGGAGVSVGAGVLVVLALGMAGVGVESSGGESPAVDEVAGMGLLVVATIVATGLGSRFVARVQVGRPDRADAASGGAWAKRARRSLLDRARSGESPWVAWLAGVAWGVPGAFYLAALALIARSRAATATTIAAIVVFNLVMFALVEVPLLAFLIAPGLTRATVQRFSSWMSAHRRTIVGYVAGVLGLYLVVKSLRPF